MPTNLEIQQRLVRKWAKKIAHDLSINPITDKARFSSLRHSLDLAVTEITYELSEKIKLWIDDRLSKPDGYTHRAKDAWEAIELLKTNRVTEVSFDHDFGNEKIHGNGYDVAKWIEENANVGTLRPFHWKVHSGNAVGRENITRAMQQAEKFWQERRNLIEP